MRVVHIAAFSGAGGASLGSLDLHLSLLAEGIDSHLVVSFDDAGSPATHSTGRWDSRLRRLNDELTTRLTGQRFRTWSLNLVPSRLPALARSLRPDVVHFHWLGDGTLTPGQLESFGVPLVWTLRDMWPLTGGCHYDEGCGRFTDRCGRCPQIMRSGRLDASSVGHWQKRRSLRGVDVTAVALSGWLARQARRSPPWRDKTIEVIHPAVDVDHFHPADMSVARRALGLPDRRTVGFIALHPFAEERKGWAPLVRAMRILAGRGERTRLTLLVTSGDTHPPRASRLPPDVEVMAVPVAHDRRLIRLLYAACDVVVMPSLYEAFGKVAIEAQSCGRPVVVFAETGAAESVSHRSTGYVAAHGDAEDLATGIGWALSTAPDGMVQRTREHAAANFSLSGQADRYMTLYSSLLTRRRHD